MNDGQRQRLLSLLSRPTAPFREGEIAGFARENLDRGGIPWFRDPWGNVVVGVADAAAYRRLVRTPSREPLRIYIAHMDHPGFHGVAWRDRNRLAIRWHGGAPVKYLRGAPLWVARYGEPVVAARFTRVRLDRDRRRLLGGEITLESPAFGKRRPPARALFGGFRFPRAARIRGSRIFTKAADDLVGVFAVLELARRLKRPSGGSPHPYLGLLTRAEEVGFVGALAHFQLNWTDKARRPLVCLSLEASRTLPGARIGAGPVLRLGDRRSIFDPRVLEVMEIVARRVLGDGYQRRHMDGGTCEATVTTALGIPTAGLSVPLGNYHNEGFEGGPDCRGPRGPAPEFVHIEDVAGLIRLCEALLTRELPWADPWESLRERLARHGGSLISRLAAKP